MSNESMGFENFEDEDDHAHFKKHGGRFTFIAKRFE